MSNQATTLKLVIVGDGTVGKTCILVSYTENKFPTEYVPTIFDNKSTTMKVDGKIVNLGLWDTAGQQQYARLRPLAYPSTDIFFITFAVTERSSLDNSIRQWLPEVQKAVPTALVVLVGNKIDLRASSPSGCLTEVEVRNKLKGLNCLYFQCSALTRIGLKELFENSVRQCLGRKSNQPVRQSTQVSSKCDCLLI